MSGDAVFLLEAENEEAARTEAVHLSGRVSQAAAFMKIFKMDDLVLPWRYR